MQVRNKVPPICKPSMNEHTQSGIYDLTQTPSGEIITTQRKASYEGMFVTSGVISAKGKYLESVENHNGH